jgi:hypothetical protein
MFTCNCYLGMQELQAINKKVQELGWDKWVMNIKF